ncbi:elongation factor P [Luteibaculum oceani]|uniref:Elongation factor P n=1 Tax=Luteibaculum oceani TaxID=1294296 RepID=A0A5C6UXZ2_9FLAO|nr:elongation factor P [Luteibaculum oceani]TXC78363.1 elongation factor P [Luteibaculum oceani]
MATTSDIKNGLCIKHNHDLFQIIEFQHVKPGKGAAFVRTKLRSLTTGKVLDNTFNAGVKIDPITIERRKYQFLYKDELGFHFMHTDTFEQINIEESLVENSDLMKEGDIVEILFHADEERPLTCDLPTAVEMEVTYTEPGIKGDTATNSLKPATLETGAEIRVPLFINIGDKIKVDTKTRSYVERVK